MYPRRATPLVLLALASAVLCLSAQVAENRATPAAGARAAIAQQFAAPVNLKVLPRSLTGQQVNAVMEQWGVDLGVRCSACHGEETDNVVATGRQRSRFSDDSQPMKGIARLMYSMTEEINSSFIAKVEGSGLPVTCGTCHRGHISPEPAGDAPVVPVSMNQVQHP